MLCDFITLACSCGPWASLQVGNSFSLIGITTKSITVLDLASLSSCENPLTIYANM